MNKSDLNEIRGVIKEEVSQIVKNEVTKIVDERVVVIVDERVTASEKRLEQKIKASEEKMISEVAKFISNDILPQLDEKADKSDIERLERKLDRALDMSIDHESRIKNIERIPVIAHELKSRKSK